MEEQEQPKRTSGTRTMQMYHIVRAGHAVETCMTSEAAFKKAKEQNADSIELVNMTWDSIGETRIDRQTIWTKRK
jgi:hypothetical protein